jgi:hypothetical protein
MKEVIEAGLTPISLKRTNTKGMYEEQEEFGIQAA